MPKFSLRHGLPMFSCYIDFALPLHEKALIARIRRQARRSGVLLDGRTSIGDDCAVIKIPRGHEALVTTDLSLENIHFRRAWHPPESVGHRCLTRGLSDIAAMGGEPLAAFLSLALPPEPAPELGRRVHPRPAEPGGQVQGESGGGRYRRLPREAYWLTSWFLALYQREGDPALRRPARRRDIRDWRTGRFRSRSQFAFSLEERNSGRRTFRATFILSRESKSVAFSWTGNWPQP